MNISDLKNAPYNPRIITEDEKLALSKSVSTFGDISGITWNKLSGNLITGHQRIAELKGKYKEITFDEIDNEHFWIIGDGMKTSFKIRVVEWDDMKEKAANIAGNSHTMSGKFELDLMPTLLEEIREFDSQIFTDFRFDQLEKDLGLMDWKFDEDKIINEDENLDGIESMIKIRCQQEIKDTVKNASLNALEGMAGVKIE